MIYETELIKKLKEESYIGEILFSREEIFEEAFIIEGNKLKAFIRNKKMKD